MSQSLIHPSVHSFLPSVTFPFDLLYLPPPSLSSSSAPTKSSNCLFKHPPDGCSQLDASPSLKVSRVKAEFYVFHLLNPRKHPGPQSPIPPASLSTSAISALFPEPMPGPIPTGRTNTSTLIPRVYVQSRVPQDPKFLLSRHWRDLGISISKSLFKGICWSNRLWNHCVNKSESLLP